ncbi:MFS transporter (plasmid) [Paraburkholderia sprentiae WSM5005]|uniref:MFS transporter n=1 Tax=Paraburkholderia sprentiae WSM5005 TaxID=754502 RepID=A0A8F4KIP4_9BURK|nr:MFS transporter [Paraburkholderia sprentiae]QXE07378.1 MFS transporter [Paraburkholderia sprentiae WSM5005]
MHRIDVRKLADEASFNRFHALVLFWGVLILVLDGYDLAVVGAALPSIMKDMGVEATKAGFMVSSALFGMMFGAIFFGTLADKLGRPLMIAVCVALFSVFTATAGLTHEPLTFSIARFVAGLGIGGVLPIVTAQMAEFAPRRIRARLVTLVFAGYSVGGVLVALIGKQLIAAYGWQSMFYVAGAPVLFIPLLLKTMPESMPFLIKNQRYDDLRKVAKKLVPEYDLHETFAAPTDDRASDASVSMLFSDGRGLSTVMIWIAFVTGLFMVYSLSSWLTKLMAMAGHSLGSALTFVLIFNVGAMIGAVLGGWLGDRLNIKYVLIGFYATGALSLTLMGYTKSTELLYLVVFIVGASTLGTQLLAYAYAGEYYPMAVRSTGVGFASGLGRLGAVCAPVVIGTLVAMKLPLEQNFMAIALAGLIGMVAVSLINQRSSAATHVYNAVAGAERAGTVSDVSERHAPAIGSGGQGGFQATARFETDVHVTGRTPSRSRKEF